MKEQKSCQRRLGVHLISLISAGDRGSSRLRETVPSPGRSAFSRHVGRASRLFFVWAAFIPGVDVLGESPATVILCPIFLISIHFLCDPMRLLEFIFGFTGLIIFE